MTGCLHILNKLPEHRRTAACRQQLESNDQLLLTEDGVLALSEPGWLVTLPEEMAIFALEPDVAARGIRGNASNRIQIIDYSDFVRLTEEADKILSW